MDKTAETQGRVGIDGFYSSHYNIFDGYPISAIYEGTTDSKLVTMIRQFFPAIFVLVVIIIFVYIFADRYVREEYNVI